jgi:cytochrome c biogenesis protein CcdA
LFAASLSLGAVVFVLAVGALFALGGRGLAGAVTFTSVTGRTIRVVVGIGLIALGLIQADRVHANLRGLEPAIHGLLRRQAGLRRRRPLAGTAVFGFGYLAAGFG